MSNSRRDSIVPREKARGTHKIGEWGSDDKPDCSQFEDKTSGSYPDFLAHDETIPITLSRLPLGKRRRLEPWTLRQNYLYFKFIYSVTNLIQYINSDNPPKKTFRV
jgi:hypothetical protein